MKPEEYIRELLFTEDCVVIPGFGGFVSNYRPARIQRETSTFMPPAKEIGFNPELKEDDHLLSDFISRREGISREEALERIDRYVALLVKRLAAGERVFLTGIGSFALGFEGEIRFSADLGVNFLIDAFGLVPFHLKELKQEESVFSRSPVFRTGEKPEPVVLPGTTPDVIRKHTVAKVAVAVVVLAILSLLPFNSRITQIITQHPATLSPLPSLYRLDFPVTLKDTVHREIVYPIPAVSHKVVNSFNLIAGSFSVLENARKLASELRSRGYASRVLPVSNGYHRVAVWSGRDPAEAEKQLARIRAADPALSIWMMKSAI